MYSETVKEYFKNPINMGYMENASSIGIIENEVCSDIIKIYLKIDKDIIVDTKFEAKGCPPVIASCCVVTKTIKDMNIEQLAHIDRKFIIKELDGLQKEKEHCAELVQKTLYRAIDNYKNKRIEGNNELL